MEAVIPALVSSLVRVFEGTRPATEVGREGLCDLVEVLSVLPDPRRRQGLRFELEAVLGLSLAAVIAGARSYRGIAEWVDAVLTTWVSVRAPDRGVRDGLVCVAVDGKSARGARRGRSCRPPPHTPAHRGCRGPALGRSPTRSAPHRAGQDPPRERPAGS